MASAIDHNHERDSLSLDGKIDGHGAQKEFASPLADFPDPDAGLSEEERAAIVCSCTLSILNDILTTR